MTKTLVDLYLGDCLQVMPELPDRSFDMIFADLPYGKTDNQWDKPINLEHMWSQFHRLARPGCPVLFTATQPFAADLINSNKPAFKYCWYWNKNNSSGWHLAKYRPLSIVEEVLVFAFGREHYYPQVIQGKPRLSGGYTKSRYTTANSIQVGYGMSEAYRYPKSLINISNAVNKGKLIPTQKPVELLLYLINTYTLQGDSVLDPVMGSGTTGEACIKLKRDFVGVEKVEANFDIAIQRIKGVEDDNTDS